MLTLFGMGAICGAFSIDGTVKRSDSVTGPLSNSVGGLTRVICSGTADLFCRLRFGDGRAGGANRDCDIPTCLRFFPLLISIGDLRLSVTFTKRNMIA